MHVCQRSRACVWVYVHKCERVSIYAPVWVCMVCICAYASFVCAMCSCVCVCAFTYNNNIMYVCV